MTKKEMLNTFAKAIETTVAQIEETKRTELVLEGKRQAFQESYDWIKTNIPEDASVGVKAAPAEEADKADGEMPAPVKEKKSK